jgi:predicted dienelactone hydrolase
MRAFEILIVVLIALRLVAALAGLHLSHRVRWGWGIALAAALGLQLIVEGYRWQMIPLYILGTLALLATILPQSTTPRRSIQVTTALLGLLLLVPAAALPALLPVPSLPTPGGPYPVGTRTLDLTDSNRPELYSGNPGEPRRGLVQIWYPAAPKPSDPLAPWLEPMSVYAPEIAKELNLPSWFLDHLIFVKSQSAANAPVADAEQPFPVLLFSHGWTGFRSQNTHQAEELASHGYVVAALEHPYGAMVTVFKDGKIAYNNPQALPIQAPPDELKAAGNRLVQQWAGDLSFALDELTQMNQAGEWKNKLNLEQVGVFGHSTGGGATVEFCARDPRCKAGIGLDAYLTPVSDSFISAGPRQPFLFLYSEAWPSQANDRLFEKLRTGMLGPVYAYTLKGTDHYDFADLPMLSPLAPWLGLKGPLPASRVLPIIDTYELAFFDQYLKGEATELFESPPLFDEVVNR